VARGKLPKMGCPKVVHLKPVGTMLPFLVGVGARRRDRGVQGASGISGVARAQQAKRASHGLADCACNAPRAAPLRIRLVLETTA
jgi:hypothetical protein